MLLKGRYEIQNELSARSRLALDQKTKQHVIVRELTLHGLKDWSLLTKLEEEAKLLVSVSHEAAPRLIDSFTLDAASPAPRFFLVQQYLSGIALSEKKSRLSQGELSQLVSALLQTLDSLHRLSPPLLHGDITPERILQKPDGSLVFVGFGAASIPDYPCHPDYIAPDRPHQKATISTELYSIGAVVYWLATHEPYSGDLSVAQLTDASLLRLLRALLASNSQERPNSAAAALVLYQGSSALARVSHNTEMTPANQASQMSKTWGRIGVLAALTTLIATGASGAALVTMLPLLLASLYFVFAKNSPEQTR
jgi:serine/threonine protein kinase